VRVALELVSEDVEAGLLAGARECNVGPLLEPCGPGAEDEGALDGEPLAGVAGEGVGVADVARLQVVARQGHLVAPIRADMKPAAFALDLLDGRAGAVSDAEPVEVAQADDAVAGGELAPGRLEPLHPEPPVCVPEDAGDGVQLGDVAPTMGDHDAPLEVPPSRPPPVGEDAAAEGERIV
jgi:hypothetical protein